MPARDWFRLPRQMLLVFFVVALVSTVTLSWLVWELVALDRTAESRRRLEDLDRAADMVTAATDRHLTALDRRLDPDAPVGTAEEWPGGAAHVRSRLGAMIVVLSGAVPYFPQPVQSPVVSGLGFQMATRLELVDRDLAGATRAYATLSHDADPALRAVALTRLARTQRKQRSWPAALATDAGRLVFTKKIGGINVFTAEIDFDTGAVVSPPERVTTAW